MNREDASELARRIKRSHRSIVPLEEWTDYLAGPFEHDLATATVDALRETDPLIPRDFGNKYRELARREASSVHPHEWPSAPSGPRLTREQREAILRANGAEWALNKRKESA